MEKAFDTIGYNYTNMTYNSTCDLFPTKSPETMTSLMTYMIQYCENNLEFLRVEQMETVKRSGFQWFVYGVVVIWVLCSLVSLLTALWGWIRSERTGFKMSITGLYLVSLGLVSIAI